mgnify:CR=1 FL=1
MNPRHIHLHLTLLQAQALLRCTQSSIQAWSTLPPTLVSPSDPLPLLMDLASLITHSISSTTTDATLSEDLSGLSLQHPPQRVPPLEPLASKHGSP